MKTYFLLLSFFLFFISNAIGQTETRLLQKDFYVDADNDGVFEERKAEFYEYDENVLLGKTLKKYNSTVDLWVTESWTEYAYDVNGCEIRSEETLNVGGFVKLFEFERNANCQITKEIEWYVLQPFVSDTSFIAQIIEFNYLPDGISYDKQNFRIDFFSGEEYLWRNEKYRFNSEGQLEEHQEFGGLAFNILGKKRTISYDQHGNILSQNHYTLSDSNPDWDFRYRTIYENEYDNQDRLVKVNSEEQRILGADFVTIGESERISDYEYECHDLVKQETNASPDTGLIPWTRSVYHFGGVNECFDVESALLEISIYPNPTLRRITIDSPIFQSGNTIISVVDISGNLLLEKNEIRRDEKVEIDLGHFPNGVYVIRLMNQDHFVQEKVVLAK